MANRNVTRRGVITVDMGCKLCEGTGFRNEKIRIGWGPSNPLIHQVISTTVRCSCLEVVASPDDALKEG